MAVLEDILLFFDPMPGALPIYERLFERAQAELGPFSVRVQKTQITCRTVMCSPAPLS